MSHFAASAVPPRLPRQAAHPLEPVLRIPEAAADLSRRGAVPSRPDRAESLEGIARLFIASCNLMYLDRPLDRLSVLLESTAPERSGFALEGAAMGAAIRDSLSVADTLLRDLRAEFGRSHDYLISVGAGWAMARTPWRAARICATLDPLHAALAHDGRGFHDLYFHPRLARSGRIARYRGPQAASYDAGLGRAIWFIASGDPVTALSLIGAFAEHRRADLFAGLGLAMTFAGPATGADWRTVLEGAAGHAPALGQGICFAAEALRQGGSLTENAGIACRAVLAMETADAAAVARTRKPGPGPLGAAALAAYETWRHDIRAVIRSRLEERA